MAFKPTAHSQDRYTILGAIHRGGMGEILLARVEGADGFSRKVVLKGLLPALLEDDVSLELFRREAQIMARLEHPNIVRTLDFTYVGDQPYLAMEYVRGRNFHQVIQRATVRQVKLPIRIAAFVVAEALRGIHYAHHARDDEGNPLEIIHRDISPGNILLSFFGEVKVTDFGIAKAVGARSLTGPRSIRGKARYAAPEVVRGDPATVRSDIYAAGVVLAEAITGEPLWDRRVVSQTLIQIVTEPRERTLERIFEKLSEEPPGLRAALRGSLALNPEERFSSAQDLADALDVVCRLSGGPVTSVELSTFLRKLFEGIADVPREDGTKSDPAPAHELRTDPAAASAHAPGKPIQEEDITPLQRPPRESTPPSVPRPYRPPHWSTPEREQLLELDLRCPTEPPSPSPVHDPGQIYLFPRGGLAPEAESAAYFSELIDVPSETARERSGSVADDVVQRVARMSWRLSLQNPVVLILLGVLLGAAAALVLSILAVWF
jgi:eukaryotic-like serine/threonine-protein kinase